MHWEMWESSALHFCAVSCLLPVEYDFFLCLWDEKCCWRAKMFPSPVKVLDLIEFCRGWVGEQVVFSCTELDCH